MFPHDDSSPAKHSLRILYAEDMHALREIARISLTRDGHQIDCVGDGQEAINRLSADAQAYDLVITDHQMPRVNGVELVTRMRELPFQGKVLVFCSELDPHVAEQYRELRVDRILYKPVFPSELRQVLADLYQPAWASS